MDCRLMIADLRFQARLFPFPPNVAGATAVPSLGSGRAPVVRGLASASTGETPVPRHHVVEQFRHLGFAPGHLPDDRPPKDVGVGLALPFSGTASRPPTSGKPRKGGLGTKPGIPSRIKCPHHTSVIPRNWPAQFLGFWMAGFEPGRAIPGPNLESPAESSVHP